MKDEMKRCAPVTGLGGWKCPCCGPVPKARPKARRQARKAMARETRRMVHEAYAE